MNRQKLIQKLAEEQDISKSVASQYVERFFCLISNALARGKRVEIRGLCTFKIKEYPGYTGHNPKTGKTVTVKPKKLPFFKMGAELRERVNGQCVLISEIDKLENRLDETYAMLLQERHGQALFERAIEVLGNEQNAMRWFLSKVKGLGYKTPFDCIQSEQGRQEVEDMLGRIEYGVYY